MAEDKVKLEIEVPKKALIKHIRSEEESDKEEAEERKESKEKEQPGLASYDPKEMLKAPLESPEPVNKKPPNRHQQRVMMLGFIFILISPFLFAFINFSAFVVMALAGAFIIAFGVLVRV